MLGADVPTVGGLINGLKTGQLWNCECIQIYLTPSRTWNVPDLDEAKVKAFRDARDNSSIREVIAHVPFLVNLASGDVGIHERSIARLRTELLYGERLGVTRLVLHPGSAGTASRSVGVKRVAAALKTLLADVSPTAPKILLETMAGQGAMVGSSFEELAELLSSVERPDFLGVCFDTAHVFFAGYDIRGYKGYAATMSQFDDIVGTKWISAFHVNDAMTRLGSHHDRHANIGEGHLGLQIFHALVRDARFRDIPMTLEIPDREEKSAMNVALLKKLRDQTETVPLSKEKDTEPLQLGFGGLLE